MLTKRGFAWRKLWRPKWVALHGAEIVYMDKEPTVFNHGLKITKALLTSSTKIDPDDLDGNPMGFAIHINDGKSPVWYLRASTVREKKDWLMRLSHVMAIIHWLENFEKVRVLGLGGTGIVYELLHKTNGTRLALKEIEIKSKAQMQVALQEAEMLKEIMENVSHPNIMHIEKVFQVGSKFYLVFPLCSGGELYEHVIRRGKFTEQDAAKLTYNLMSAIHALHSRDILHLDIKPENILFESSAEDSQIKLTDFGLSKFFTDQDQMEAPVPTVEELDNRLKDFSENGVLDTMKLKGTVGYMSPELVLTGHTSKATDMFASGVVLYILLCGHPPFQSKSNRDVLEKTAKGLYRMDGGSWRDISDEAKDLIRQMLTRDPQKRITVEGVLAHPWLALKDAVEEEENVDTSLPSASTEAGDVDVSLQLSTMRISTTGRKGMRNLSGLRLLSEHVAERRSEKFMSGLTNLVSFIQGGGGRDGSKLIQFIRLANGEFMPNLGADQDSSCMEDRFIFLSPYVKNALCGAIRRGCENGRMTIEQFLSVLKKLGIASGLPGMFLCRFIDRDGDGFISADDLFTTQALVMQRSETFLRVVFRVYSESIWYPGRQLNLVNYYQQQSTPKKKSISGGTRILDDATLDDVIEPPKFITARHVAEVFTKLGYDAEDSKSIFNVLCESMNRIRDSERSPSRGSDDGESTDEGASPLAAPSQSIPDHNVQQQSSIAPQVSQSDEKASPPSTPTSKISASTSSSALSPQSAQVPSSTTKGLAPAKMDVADFIHCIEFDDVLVQAILRRPRSGFLELVNNSKLADARDDSGVGRDTSTLEEELVSALLSAREEARMLFPIANAVARGTLSVLSGMKDVINVAVDMLE